MTRIKPAIWLPKETPERHLINVLFEIRPNYIIYWYHWPKDGYAIIGVHEDFEPVILIFKESHVVDIGIN